MPKPEKLPKCPSLQKKLRVQLWVVLLWPNRPLSFCSDGKSFWHLKQSEKVKRKQRVTAWKGCCHFNTTNTAHCYSFIVFSFCSSEMYFTATPQPLFISSFSIVAVICGCGMLDWLMRRLNFSSVWLKNPLIDDCSPSLFFSAVKP